jgi:hypothetical protein
MKPARFTSGGGEHADARGLRETGVGAMMPSLCLAGVEILMILAGVTSPGAQSLPLASRKEFQDLLGADSIVRGTVLSVEDDYVPANAFWPDWPGDGYIELSVIRLDVEEVIWGDISIEDTSFLVEMSTFGLRMDYTVGQRIVVGLQYRSQFRGGTYFGGPVEALFIFDGANWIRRGHVTGQDSFTLEEIRAVMAPYRLESVEESADIIVTGVVTRAREGWVTNPSGVGAGRVWTVSIDVEDVLKGEGVPDPLTFEMFGGGYYWPPWAEVTPRRIEEGERYCAFVRRIDDRLYSAGGVNGFFAADGDRLIRNELPLPATVDHVRVLAQTGRDEQ